MTVRRTRVRLHSTRRRRLCVNGFIEAYDDQDGGLGIPLSR